MSEETKVHETVEQTDSSQPETPSAAEMPSADEMGNVAALKKGDVVTGKVVKIEDQQAIVDIGYKFDGVIPLRELSFVPLENVESAVQLGQEVQCKVIQVDDEKEKLLLSKKAVDAEKAWETLQERFEKQEVFEVKVADVVKGGLVVDVGVRGFVPASMVERHFVEDFSDYKGRTLRVKVKELDREKNKVILSQKDVLEEEYAARKKESLNRLSVGQQLEGTVQRLTSFGAFVDIGGIDGLVHISEMSWEHVDKPSDVVREGDRVKVVVLKVDPDNEKVSLSMKAAQPGPWEKVKEQFQVGDIVTGKVKRLASFGAFVELIPGVEGLVHVSQIAHRHIATPHEVLKTGDEVKVKILDIQPEDKRISLSIKATEEPPQVKREQLAKELNNENVSLNQKGFGFTLGEKFGDKLSKFK